MGKGGKTEPLNPVSQPWLLPYLFSISPDFVPLVLGSPTNGRILDGVEKTSWPFRNQENDPGKAGDEPLLGKCLVP